MTHGNPLVATAKSARIGSFCALALGLAVLPDAARADPSGYSSCSAGLHDGMHEIMESALFEVDDDKQMGAILQSWEDYLRKQNFLVNKSQIYCTDPLPKDIAEPRRRYAEDSLQKSVLYVGWSPTPQIPQGPIKTYTLRYEDGERAGHGYASASIKMNYRFLLCADEIQVAYGIDRNSLSHDDRYVVRMIAGRNFEYATPTSQPVVPQAVPINLRVTIAQQSAIKTVARLQDAATGVSLGMGCFTGQTKRVGMLKALLGPAPTRTQVQSYLNSLILAGSTIGVAPDLDMPLTNAEFPAPPRASATRRPAARKRG